MFRLKDFKKLGSEFDEMINQFNMTLEEIKKWMPPIYEKIEEWRRLGIFVFNCCQHDEEF